MLAMTLQIEPRHNLSPNELDAIEDRLDDHNSRATGRHDGRGLGFVIRDNAGQMVGVAAGYTWAGCVYRKPKPERSDDGFRQG